MAQDQEILAPKNGKSSKAQSIMSFENGQYSEAQLYETGWDSLVRPLVTFPFSLENYVDSNSIISLLCKLDSRC